MQYTLFSCITRRLAELVAAQASTREHCFCVEARFIHANPNPKTKHAFDDIYNDLEETTITVTRDLLKLVP
jgi:hypothetical protein